jgi:proteasome ATPase
MMERICSAGESGLPFDERLMMLTQLRGASNEIATETDRYLMERILRQQEAISSVQDEHAKLRSLIDSLTAPTLLAKVDSPGVRGVLVHAGENERRVVQLGEGLEANDLSVGDEVFLSHERNFVVARSCSLGHVAGEIATYSRTLADGRLVLRSRDEEVIVLPNKSLQGSVLKQGDGVRFSRSAGIAFEKVEQARGESYFLEATPTDTFRDIGGLDREIEQIKQMITLHKLHPEKARQYRLRPKRSILLTGRPGNGKTKLARATCNWVAGMSRSGRARFVGIKPGELSSMWFGASESAYRRLFAAAREAALEDPDIPVIIFIDEVDSIGSVRGEGINKIDDKIQACVISELDGLEDRGNVLVMAATNRADSLDPAMIRAGRLGDLILEIPPPNRKGAHAVLGCYLPADIPYASGHAGQASAREELLQFAVGQLFAENGDTELAHLTLRDGKRRLIRAADLLNGASLQSIALSALERAVLRDDEGGPAGVCAADISAAISYFLVAAPRALTPRNARNYIKDLPQDVDVTSVDIVERRVKRPYLYRVEAA